MNFIRIKAAAGTGRTVRDLLIGVDGVIDVQVGTGKIEVIYDNTFVTNNAAQTIAVEIKASSFSYAVSANDKANFIKAIEESIKAPNSIPYFKFEDESVRGNYAFGKNIDKIV